jgi:iron complex outermembrane receptor protein
MTNAAGMNFKSWLLVGTLGIAGLATTLAQAQTAPADNTTATERGGLQEVVVTATRREESLSKVPISVTALTQEDIDQRGIKDFQDIVRFTPGVTIDNSGTNAISIRGISSSGGAGTTGIYIDDTPIQMRSLGFNPDDAKDLRLAARRSAARPAGHAVRGRRRGRRRALHPHPAEHHYRGYLRAQ